MEIVRPDSQTLSLCRISLFTANLLRQIPSEADPGDDESANDRLFSKPTIGKDKQEKGLNEEWKQYVEPGLRHLFQSANETVSQDLKNLTKTHGEGEDEEFYTLDIPTNHLEQWLSALNQARLVMAARNAFTEEELDRELPLTINSTRDMNLLQNHFYAELQFAFIWELENS